MTEIEALLTEHGLQDSSVIRCIAGTDEFLARIGEAIENGNAVVIVPTRRTLRRFHNTRGFQAAMNEITNHFPELEQVIEPGLHGNLHVAAFRCRSR